MSRDEVGSSEVIIISSTSSNAGTYRYGSKVYTAAIAVTLILGGQGPGLVVSAFEVGYDRRRRAAGPEPRGGSGSTDSTSEVSTGSLMPVLRRAPGGARYGRLRPVEPAREPPGRPGWARFPVVLDY